MTENKEYIYKMVVLEVMSENLVVSINKYNLEKNIRMEKHQLIRMRFYTFL